MKLNIKPIVKVSADKLSLAIGKAGQNVRLAAHLTNWKIDIIESSEDGEVKVATSEEDGEVVVVEDVVENTTNEENE